MQPKRPVLPRGLFWRGPVIWGRFWLPDPHKREVKRSLRTNDLRAALARYDDTKAELLSESYGDREKTPEQVLESYLDSRRSRVSPGHLRDVTSRIRSFVAFARLRRLDALTPAVLEAYMDRRLEDGRSPRTAAADMRAVTAWLRWCVRNRILDSNPCRGAQAPDGARDRVDIVYLEPQEVEELLTAAAAPVPMRGGKKARARRTPVRAFVACGIFAGLRASEVLHLDGEDVDLERKQLMIRGKDGWRTKTRKNRVVPLFPRLERVLTPLVRPGPLFRTSTGKRYRVDTSRRELQLAAKRAGISKHITWHVLRHTFATRLLSEGVGVSLWDVSGWLGHSSVQVTERHYARFVPDGPSVARAALVFR